jgi:hypothetical protein
MATKPNPEQSLQPTSDSSVMRYDRQQAFAPPTDVDGAWVERRLMIKQILHGGIYTMRDRVVKYVLAKEKEEFYRNAEEQKPQPPLTLEALLDVFNS